jgi:FkbM family methyltransferase
MVDYTPTDDCCGVRPTYSLLNEDMLRHFRSCPGGTPEAPLIDWAWQTYGQPGFQFIDIGSHVGSWALPFAMAGMEVIAFEANTVIADLLSNASGGMLEVHDVALGDHPHVAQLTAPGIDGGMASIVLKFNGPIDMPVAVMVLDDYDFEPRIMKIDVEGAELDVLRGAAQTIRRHQPIIFFECWPTERGQRIEELFAYVLELGYTTRQAPVVPPWLAGTGAGAWPEMWVATPYA